MSNRATAVDRGSDAAHKRDRMRMPRALVGGIVMAAIGVLLLWWVARPPVVAPPDTNPSTAANRPGDKADSAATQRSPQPAAASRQPSVLLPSVPVPGKAEQFQDEAVKVATDLRSRYPKLPEALHVAALTHAQLRQTAEAEKLWRECIALAPGDERYRVNLAVMAMDRGNSDLAAETLQAAANAGSKSHAVLHNLSVALTNLGRCEEAIEVAQKLLEADPASPGDWLILGQAQLKLGRAAEAEASLRKAIEHGAETSSAYFALANACARQGKGQEAAQARAKFAQLSADRPIAVEERFQVLSSNEARRIVTAILTEAAAVHLQQDDSLEAERLLLRSLAVDPTSAATCRALADLYRQAGMMPEERVVRRRLVEVEPQTFDNYFQLALLSAQLGEPEAAEATLKLALAIDPDTAAGYATLAEFYLQTGKGPKARWYAQEAIRRQPTAAGYRLLAQTCQVLGDEGDATAALAMARKLESKSP